MQNPDKIDWQLVDKEIRFAQNAGISPTRPDTLNVMVENGLVHHDGRPTRQAIDKGLIHIKASRIYKIQDNTRYLTAAESYYTMLAHVLKCFALLTNPAHDGHIKSMRLPHTIKNLENRAGISDYTRADWFNVLFASFTLYDSLRQSRLCPNDITELRERFTLVCNVFLKTMRHQRQPLDSSLSFIKRAVKLAHQLD